MESLITYGCDSKGNDMCSLELKKTQFLLTMSMMVMRMTMMGLQYCDDGGNVEDNENFFLLFQSYSTKKYTTINSGSVQDL